MEEKKKVGVIGKDKKAVAKAIETLEESGMEIVEMDKMPEPNYLEIRPEPFFPDMKDFYGDVPKKDRGRVVEPVRNTPKIQNNELCPCGSGKKYKKCCK